ncbi:hypothetical protein ACWDZ4_15285 [Streptomyces sp. NPDC003016]
MISEPELVGDFPAAQAPETVTSTAGEHPGAPHGRRPWLWAVGGAVAASAVWAGGLYAYGSQEAVDTRGYRVGEGLCGKAELSALTVNLGKRSGDPTETVSEHSALDKITCNFGFEPTGKPTEDGFSVHYEAQLVAEIHKKSDPEPEFEAIVNEPHWSDGLPPRPEEVPGLGEKAYLTTGSDATGSQLKVLDGGAVFTLDVSANVEYQGDEEKMSDAEYSEPDLSSLPPFMIEDMRDLMDALRG